MNYVTLICDIRTSSASYRSASLGCHGRDSKVGYSQGWNGYNFLGCTIYAPLFDKSLVSTLPVGYSLSNRSPDCLPRSGRCTPRFLCQRVYGLGVGRGSLVLDSSCEGRRTSVWVHQSDGGRLQHRGHLTQGLGAGRHHHLGWSGIGSCPATLGSYECCWGFVLHHCSVALGCTGKVERQGVRVTSQ